MGLDNELEARSVTRRLRRRHQKARTRFVHSDGAFVARWSVSPEWPHKVTAATLACVACRDVFPNARPAAPGMRAWADRHGRNHPTGQTQMFNIAPITNIPKASHP